MAGPMNPTVVDLSHHNVVRSFDKAKAAGIKAVIHKATQGTAYVDRFYAVRREAALESGLLWGAYHFADEQDVGAQVAHFLSIARPGKNTLLALDWEPNGSHTMSLAQAKDFLRLVHEKTGQKPVLYSGNLVKECLKGQTDPFLCSHRLWLAQYGPKAVLPPGFTNYWLWQYTGDGVGREPHEIDGIPSKGLDLSIFGGKDMAAEWAPVEAGVLSPAHLVALSAATYAAPTPSDQREPSPRANGPARAGRGSQRSAAS
jgi:lysozyme